MQRRWRYDLKLSLARRKQPWTGLGMFSTDFPCWCRVSTCTNNPTTGYASRWSGLLDGKMCAWGAQSECSECPLNGLLPFITKRNAMILLNLCSTDKRFRNFRSTFDAEMKRLHGSGLGTSSKQAEPISLDEEAMQWFGTHAWWQSLA